MILPIKKIDVRDTQTTPHFIDCTHEEFGFLKMPSPN